MIICHKNKCNFMIILLLNLIGLVICNSDFFSDALKIVLSDNETYFENSDCEFLLRKYLEDLNKNTKWALYMSDATIKQIPSDSFYEGNWMLAGSYDQCLSINVHPLKTYKNWQVWGKYCTVEYAIRQFLTNYEDSNIIDIINETESKLLQPEYLFNAINLTAGICVPHTCTTEDLNDILHVAEKIQNLNHTFAITKCHTKAPDQRHAEDQFDVYDWSFLGFIALMVFILISSTIYDYQMQCTGTKIYHKWLTTFSLYTNTKSLFSLETTPSLSCLAGIRVISTIWIIMHHMSLVYGFVPLRNSIPILSQSHTVGSMFISNAIMSVDTFFCLSGLVMVYSFLKAPRNGKKFNILHHYIHRYIRITPALAAELFLHVSLIRHMGSGPIWTRVESVLVENCQESWWAVLLHIQNFISPSKLCMLQSWYISTDFQMYLLSPLILLPIKYGGNMVKIVGLVICLVISIVTPFVISWSFSINGLAQLAVLKNPYYFGWYYENVAARCGPWIVGIWLGYLLFHKDTNGRINHWLENKKIYWTGMIVSLFLLGFIIFGPVLLYTRYDRLLHSIFLATHRILWAFPISFIIYSCTIHKNGIINRFLSHWTFQILSRLTYCMYILHVLLYFLKMGQVRQPIFALPWQGVHDFIGTTFDTIILSIIWTLVFEIPFMRIDTLIFKTSEVRTTKL